MIERGYTWSEEWRHKCEVRYVLAMPNKLARRDFLDGVARRRGQPAGDALRQAVRDAWHGRSATPTPQGVGARQPTVGAVHPSGEPSTMPARGSFLDPSSGGDSDPVDRVVSGVAA